MLLALLACLIQTRLHHHLNGVVTQRVYFKKIIKKLPIG